jgi:hypothetical protein
MALVAGAELAGMEKPLLPLPLDVIPGWGRVPLNSRMVGWKLEESMVGKFTLRDF